MILRKFLVIPITIFCFFSCGEKKNSNDQKTSSAPQALGVEAMIVKPSSIDDQVEVSGTLMPFESTEIRPEVTGRIVALNIHEGSSVKKGTVLVKLFDADLQAGLNKLEVQLQIAEKTEERQKELLKISGISQQDYDLSLLQVNNLKADIELTRVNIGKTEIRAPFDGRIGLRNVSEGAYVSPLTLLTTISQVNQLKIEFSIPEKYSSQVTNGATLNFTIDGTDKIFSATVSATESKVEENSRSLRVRAVVKGQDKFLVPGTFARVKFILDKNSQALMVPTQAIIPQARNKQLIIYRGGKADFETVTTGVRDSSNVQVLTGIQAGDTVITTGLLFLKQDAPVQLTKIQ
jgi:membrane fusion protein (multidrug efflux system)